jgi:4-hydroxy-3-polyprenylbenzoate decarboxylase
MITAPKITDMQTAQADAQSFVEAMLSQQEKLTEMPLIVLCDDSAFAAATLNNFVWVTFTRANPSHDIYGVAAETVHKHWGCRSSLVIDARIKPHHAPPLVPDKKAMERVDRLFQKGGALAKWG